MTRGIGPRRAFAALDALAPDPAGGLPEDFFLWISRFVPLVNVDLIIRDGAGRNLLTWRDDEFYGSGWHVPGGIIRYRERIEERIHATAREEIGCDVAYDPAPLAVEQSVAPERRERSHFISLVYLCRVAGEPDPARRYCGGTPRRGLWAWHRGAPPDLLPAQAAYRPYLNAAVNT